MNENTKQVRTILKYTYGLIPIIAGLDKFTNILTDWGQYVSGGFLEILPLDVAPFMMVVGVVEIVAGVLVLIKPKIGALIVTIWLVLIALTLVFSGSYIDVAVRDLVMAVGAFSLYKLMDK